MMLSKPQMTYEEAVKVPFVEDGMAVGLFGGSFNPPHDGHVHVAKTALKRLGLNKVWWMVSPGNPLKDISGLPSLEARLAKSQALVTDPRIDVTGLEKMLQTRYSADLIHRLKVCYPTVHFVWIMGADNLTHFHKWDRWEEIVSKVPIAVIDRPGDTLSTRSSHMARKFWQYRLDESDAQCLKRMQAPAWTFIHAPRSHLSSTALRNGL